MRLVKRVLLEVISDDCQPVYQNQPRCSEVVAALARSGFVPLTPLPCIPSAPPSLLPARSPTALVLALRAASTSGPFFTAGPCSRRPTPPRACSGMWRGSRANHRCELEFVFVNAALNVTMSDATPEERNFYYESHQGHLNLCNGVYPVSEGYGDQVLCNVPGCDRMPAGGGAPSTSADNGLLGSVASYIGGRPTKPTKLLLPPEVWTSPPPGVVFAAWPGGSGQALPVYYAKEWGARPRKHAEGRPYICPMTCSPSHFKGASNANATHMLGVPWAQLAARKLNCPFW